MELFGEENINFGPVPPTWNNDICFIVDGMDYVTCIRYIYDTYHNDEITLAHTDPPIYDASINIHLFQNHEQCVFKQQIKIMQSAIKPTELILIFFFLHKRTFKFSLYYIY